MVDIVHRVCGGPRAALPPCRSWWPPLAVGVSPSRPLRWFASSCSQDALSGWHSFLPEPLSPLSILHPNAQQWSEPTEWAYIKETNRVLFITFIIFSFICITFLFSIKSWREIKEPYFMPPSGTMWPYYQSVTVMWAGWCKIMKHRLHYGAQKKTFLTFSRYSVRFPCFSARKITWWPSFFSWHA